MVESPTLTMVVELMLTMSMVHRVARRYDADDDDESVADDDESVVVCQ
jgi:hypothetical protein